MKYKKPKCRTCLSPYKFCYYKNAIERKSIMIGWYCEECKEFIPKEFINITTNVKMFIGLKEINIKEYRNPIPQNITNVLKNCGFRDRKILTAYINKLFRRYKKS